MRVRSVRRIKKRNSHMIKCLLTEFGQAGRENIWFSQDARTLSQMFSRPALPLSQKVPTVSRELIILKARIFSSVNFWWECACFDPGTPWPSSPTYSYFFIVMINKNPGYFRSKLLDFSVYPILD